METWHSNKYFKWPHWHVYANRWARIQSLNSQRTMVAACTPQIECQDVVRCSPVPDRHTSRFDILTWMLINCHNSDICYLHKLTGDGKTQFEYKWPRWICWNCERKCKMIIPPLFAFMCPPRWCVQIESLRLFILFAENIIRTDIIGLEMINSGSSTEIWREIVIFEID